MSEWRSEQRQDFLDIAWRDFIDWASREPDIIAQYEHETGNTFPSEARNPLDAMIDEATGYKPDFTPFVHWVTREHWGVEMAPEKLRAEMRDAGTDWGPLVRVRNKTGPRHG